MKFANLPIIFSLIAGLAVCIATIISKMDFLSSLIWLLVALLLFYVIGIAFRALFNVVLNDMPSEMKEVIAEDLEMEGIDLTDVEEQ